MEQLNHAIIIGTIGRCNINSLSDTKLATFSMATNYGYKDNTDNYVIETQWHAVRAFESDKIKDLDKLTKGTPVKVEGRIRNLRYTNEYGEEKTVTEILASSIEILHLPEGENLNIQLAE